MPIESILWNLVSVAVGAVVTWLVARYFYLQASKELQVEARELKRVSLMTLRFIETQEVAQIVRDDSGAPVALQMNAEAVDKLSVTSYALDGVHRELSPDEIAAEQAARDKASE